MKKTICAIIKNEQAFLKEWIEWHLSLGFDTIHLYEDKGSESHEEIVAEYNNVFLRRYETDEEIKALLEAQGSAARQTVLYNWFGTTHKEDYDWVAFIDIDEFIVFNNGYTLDSFCKEFEPYSAVLMNWRMMGANGHISKPEVSVTEAYTMESPSLPQDYGYNYKSLCNLKKWKGLIHNHLAEGCVNTNHKEDIHEIQYDKVALNHYFTKSWEDWCDRIFKRGGTQNGHRTLAQFFEVNPDMEHLRIELIRSVADLVPVGTYWLDKENRIIAGGNVRKVMALNQKNDNIEKMPRPEEAVI